MLNKFVNFVLTQRIFVLVLTLALMVFGYRSFTNLPIEAFPDVQDVQVQIVTQFPGQAAEEVERAVTLPIEREMSGVPGQTQLRSVSITGLSVVTMTFKDGTDDYFARQQVLEKLQGVTLPTGVQASIAPLTTAVGEIYRYIIEAPAGTPENEIRSLQDWVVRPELRIVPGVADVVSFGGTVKEYQVQVDPNALKRYGITLDQVNAALTNNSSNVGGGTIRRGDEALVVRGVGLFNRTEDIGQVVVTAKNGKTVLVSDIAEVAVGHRQRSGIVSYNQGDSYVMGIIQMSKGGNAAKIIENLKQKIDVVNQKLPKGVKLRQIYDRTELLHHTVMTVFENLVVGAVLVMTILMIFLRNWRAALIVVTVIPLSLLCAFIMLDIRGIPANLISLGAVDFGIIIDSAVVLVEALMVRLALKHHEETSNVFLWRKHVLKDTVVEMGHPILFAKAIIILAFIPIFTFQRVEGKIFSPVALTLSFAMLGALILTMTLIPTLLMLTMKHHSLAERHSQWMHNIQEWYRKVLQKADKQKRSVMLVSTALLAITLGLAPGLGSEFLPKLDEGNIWLAISLPPSTALDKTKEIERQVRAILLSYPEVKTVVSHVGRPDDGTDPKGPNNMEILADLKPHDQWKFHDKEQLIEDMTKKISVLPGVPTNFSQVIQDNVEESLSGVKGEIAVKIFGPNLDILTQKSEQVASILKNIQGATDVDAVKIGGQSELNITINREKIARLGINVIDVNNTIQTALADNPVNTFFEGDKRFDITLRLKAPYRDSIDSIGNLQINLPNGAGTVDLADIAQIETKQGAGRISREAGGRNASVKANLLGRDQGSFIAEAQQKVRDQVNLPPGYYIVWGGQFENQQRAAKRLEIIIPITVFLIFAFLFWAFRSVRMSMLILLMVPFTMIGGIAGLALAGLHFSVSAAVGFIAVAGISVQNGVIMLEQILHFEKHESSDFHSAIEGAVARLRPILMTALMAGLGLLPAALSHGIGSETQRPFAVVIVGGIVSATFFTLLLLPLSYTIFKDKPKEEE
ncbi:CusA/CzcA family heavy metal efflux RND transporter [Undibacterium sp. Jales W-56]|uniref:efflux RND transporter permease subunit n=1 Tax=Undibacterium sp. Jales W-56 TaxID=2897325 RepID=UPI0021CF2E02|nr:CusA/CzcA family heavy metal efflux RND transporter [Undibacterium sp. Jales W-56]MCU6435482.1 CusA/CzcA family heavy metal efflux RND transporter [Undibacterium sp. Jales W-56]